MRVVLCDDHLLFTEALADQLAARGHEVVATVSTVEKLAAVVMIGRPQAVLLDLSFPHGSGLVAARDLRVSGFSGRIVLCTGRPRRGSRPPASRCGSRYATGCWTWWSRRPPTTQRSRPRSWADRVSPPPAPSAFSTLTSREVEVLGLLADGLSTTQVAADMGVATSTVHAHVKSAMLRLGSRSRFGAVHQYLTALGGAPRSSHARSTPGA